MSSPRAKRKSSRKPRALNRARLTSILLALAAVLSLHSCSHIPSGRDLAAAGAELEVLAQGLGNAVRREAGAVASRQPARSSPTAARTGSGSESFSACRHFFAGGKPPVVEYRPSHRALCYNAFTILHSGESKTAVYVAQRLNRVTIEETGEVRTNKFFADARLPSAERATPADSGYDNGHMAPASDMPSPQAMAQSFSMANLVPQATKHNRGAWAKSVEMATRKYASRATGDVYVITGPVFVPNIALSKSIGLGKVRVPQYLYKLVYDENQHRAWAHWHLNDNATQASRPITYSKLVRRTGVDFLPGAHLTE